MPLHPPDRFVRHAEPAKTRPRVDLKVSSNRRSKPARFTRRWARRLAASLLSVSLVGCARIPGGAASNPVAQQPPPSVIPAPSATPFAARFSELTLQPGAASDAWIANGLVTNDSSVGAVDLKLRLSLLDAQGQTLAIQVIAPLLDRLGPGETSPFTASFGGASQAVRFRAEVAASTAASFVRAAVTVQGLQAVPDASGGISVIGTLANGGNRAAAVAQVAVAARAAGKLLAIGTRDAGLSYLRPGESAAFLAHLPIAIPPAQLTAWVDAVETSTPIPLPTAMTASARVATTSQGLPFAVGSVRNADQQARIASLIVTLKDKSRILGLANVELPIPLAPGETTVFAVTSFPGLAARMASAQASLADLIAEVVFDPVASGAAGAADSVPLDVSVTSYEAVGSTLFLKGDVTNHRSTPVQSPTVAAAVRSTEGKPVTAGWLTVALALAPGEKAAFTLPMPLPSGIDPAMAEYDLQAAGFLSR